MNESNPTPYPDLHEVLRSMVSSMQGVLGDKLIGVYLQGSFAIGDFDEHSDVDWIVALGNPLTSTEVDALQAMHGRLYDHSIGWAQHLEGSYFPQDILRQHADCTELLWYLDNGSRELVRATHCNTIVVRATVRQFGVPLVGPPPDTLIDPIPVEALRRDMLTTMFDWGREILADPEHYNNRFYQAFIVHSYCRMLHDTQRGYPGSKRAAVNWAKATLDPAWHGLIDRTWAGRPNPALSVRQRANPADFAATLEFVRYVMEEGAAYAEANNLR